jgi:hypothetical protein
MKRLSVALLMLTLASLGLECGGETPVEQAEEQEGVEEVAPETTEAAAAPPPNFNCASFATREEAQARLDDGDEAVRDVLDPNGNGTACDEPGSNVGADARADAERAEGRLPPNDQAALTLGECQGEEALADLGHEEFAAFSERIVDEVVSGKYESIQDAYVAYGYTCGGRAEEVLSGE